MCCGARAFPHRQTARRSRREDCRPRSFRPALGRVRPQAACEDIDTAEFRPPKPGRAAQLRGPTQRRALATLRGRRIATAPHNRRSLRASFLGFPYREALRDHDAAWARAIALPAPASVAEIQQYQYPHTPLAASLFRMRGGSFEAGNVHDGAFAQFADVETLWRHNTFLVGRDFRRARPGDLLFFRQDGQKMPFHAMIFLGRSQIEPGGEQYVIYHTGPSGNLRGEIRRLSVAQLVNYPEARWRPISSNPSFLGVYRWNILRGGE